jgi:hypothetical protein
MSVLTEEKARVPYFVILLRNEASVINIPDGEFRFLGCDSQSLVVIVVNEAGTFVQIEDFQLQAEQCTTSS